MPSERYLNFVARKNELLADQSICPENRDIIARFYEFEEHKLRRQNQLAHVDDKSVLTLEGYLFKFRNVNAWFGNRPWASLSAADIKKVYDDLEDGVITSIRGNRFISRLDYYNKIFKSKPFELAGKAGIARELIAYAVPRNSDVRFVAEEGVRKIISCMFRQKHRLLGWLAFDIGENINSLLLLRKKHCIRAPNPNTSEPEYRILLHRDILKRSRTPRAEITNYRETVELLDLLLEGLGPDDLIFDFEYRGAAKMLTRAATMAGVKCEPNEQNVTWKDLRSGMACDLLRKGWSTDEVKARLGHRPSSREIDKYVNYLALDRHAPKAKARQFELASLQSQLEAAKTRERLGEEQLAALEENQARLEEQLALALLARRPRLAAVEEAIALKSSREPGVVRAVPRVSVGPIGTDRHNYRFDV